MAADVSRASSERRLEAAFSSGRSLEPCSMRSLSGISRFKPCPFNIGKYVRPLIAALLTDRPPERSGPSYRIRSTYNGKLLIEYGGATDKTSLICVDLLALKKRELSSPHPMEDIECQRMEIPGQTTCYPTQRGALFFHGRRGVVLYEGSPPMWTPRQCTVFTIGKPPFTVEFPSTPMLVRQFNSVCGIPLGASVPTIKFPPALQDPFDAESDEEYKWIALSGPAHSYPIISTEREAIVHILQADKGTEFTTLRLGGGKAYTLHLDPSSTQYQLKHLFKQWDLTTGESLLFHSVTTGGPLLTFAVTARDFITGYYCSLTVINHLKTDHRELKITEPAPVKKMTLLSERFLLLHLHTTGYHDIQLYSIFDLTTGSCVLHSYPHAHSFATPVHLVPLDEEQGLGLWLRYPGPQSILEEHALHTLKDPREDENPGVENPS